MATGFGLHVKDELVERNAAFSITFFGDGNYFAGVLSQIGPFTVLIQKP